jgi:hypothetical protein
MTPGSYIPRSRRQRASDLLPPKMPDKDSIRFPSPVNAYLIVSAIEQQSHTGVLVVSSDALFSRSAALLYRGKVVGCFYSDRNQPEPALTEPSLDQMLQMMYHHPCEVLFYECDERVILAMSALFLGRAIERTDSLDARSYFDYIGGSMRENAQTGCISMFIKHETTLAFFHDGEFVGCFNVDRASWSDNIATVSNALDANGGGEVSASVLRPGDTDTLGFRMSARM